ncbi:MAG: hypothetical protein ACKVXR_04330 [Planctomycetota bacterium]
MSPATFLARRASDLRVAEASPRSLPLLRTIAIAGGLAFLAGLVFAPERAWAGFLMGFVYFVGLSLSGALFIALLTMAGARWWIPLRPIPEAMSTALPYGGILALVLLAGVPSLYEWSHASAVASDHLLLHKSAWLNVPFFAARLLLCFAIWILLSRKLAQAGREPVSHDGPARARRNLVLACWFVPLFALTWSVASFDWLMSLEPHWFSTIYALLTLSGLGLAGLAACILLAVPMIRSGRMGQLVTREHLDDLGKLAVAFSLFWVYIRYCQYMLVWYTNIPEETGWYTARGEGLWAVLEPVNVALNWAIPFFVLMPKTARRSPTVMVRVAVAMLAGHAVDLYLLAGPPILGPDPSHAAWEIGPIVGAIALFFWIAARALSKRSE